MKIKFDKRTATKNPTGDPACPPTVRRAKNNSKDMLSITNAGNVERSVHELDENVNSGAAQDPSQIAGTSGFDESRITLNKRHQRAPVGARGKRRKPGGFQY